MNAQEIYTSLENLSALNKAAFVKACKANGIEREDANEFWNEKHPKGASREDSLTQKVYRLLTNQPDIGEYEFQEFLNLEGNPDSKSWKQASAYFQQQREIANEVYSRYCK